MELYKTKSIILLFLIPLVGVYGCSNSSGQEVVEQSESLVKFLYEGEVIEYQNIDVSEEHINKIKVDLKINWHNVSDIKFSSVKYINTNLPAIAVLLVPKIKNNSLIIYNHGHDGLPTHEQSFAFDFIDKAISTGFSVLIDSMPLVGLNLPDNSKRYYITAKGIDSSPVEISQSYFQWPYIHQIYQAIKGSGSSMHFFVDGSLAAAQYHSNSTGVSYFNYNSNINAYKYNNIHYVGLSGGGFVGLISCAIFNYRTCTLIAGFIPFKYKMSSLNNWGDSEQWMDSFFNRFTYEDLINMAAQKIRILNFIYNSDDDCCFSNPAALEFKNDNPSLNILIVDSSKHAFDPGQVLDLIRLNND